MNICFLILCAPPLLVFLYYMKSADVMLLCCYASDLVISELSFSASFIHKSDTVTRLLLLSPTLVFSALELYIIYKYLPLPSIFIFLK